MNVHPTFTTSTLPGTASTAAPATQTGVCALVLNEHWEVLLQQHEHRWDVPGGPSTPGEAMENTLQRCLLEQLGWPPLDPMLLTVISGPDTLTGLPGNESYQVRAVYVIRQWPGDLHSSAGQFFPLDELPGGLSVVTTRALTLLRVCLGMA